MTKRMEVYKCEICGNIVVMVHEGKGQLVCCGQPMVLRQEKTQEEGSEKHLPVLEKRGNHVRVNVGSVDHPMEEKHHIEWIELQTTNKTFRKFLKPGQQPMAEFEILLPILTVRAYCNVHGLWKLTVQE